MPTQTPYQSQRSQVSQLPLTQKMMTRISTRTRYQSQQSQVSQSTQRSHQESTIRHQLLVHLGQTDLNSSLVQVLKLTLMGAIPCGRSLGDCVALEARPGLYPKQKLTLWYTSDNKEVESS